jgi:hypothetical protein
VVGPTTEAIFALSDVATRARTRPCRSAAAVADPIVVAAAAEGASSGAFGRHRHPRAL